MDDSTKEFGAYALEDIAELLRAHAPDTRPSERAEKHAAVAMILREGESGGVEILFMQRADRAGDPWSGQMSFPGGRMDAGDKTLEEAARRETFEEVGIELAPEMLIGRLHDIDGGRLTAHRLAVSPFVYYHPEPPEELVVNEEVADTVWVPLEYLVEAANIRPYVFDLDPLCREFPAFCYADRYTIWGLTYRIIVNFVSLFGVQLPAGEPKVTSVE